MEPRRTIRAHPVLSSLAAMSAVLAMACAPAASSTAAAPASAPDGDIVVPSGPATSSPEAIREARADSIRRPYTAADIEFMSGMIGHHAQAVKMASWAPSHGASSAVQTFAARIALAQKTEIGAMQTWLRDRNQPVPEANARGMKMKMDGMDDMMMLMPGMLTEEQMHQLDAARGKEFDRLFLTFMMQHHRGAIQMVDKLFHTDGAAQDEFVFKFANDVQADQATEIDRMQQMLDAMNGN